MWETDAKKSFRDIIATKAAIATFQGSSATIRGEAAGCSLYATRAVASAITMISRANESSASQLIITAASSSVASLVASSTEEKGCFEQIVVSSNSFLIYDTNN